MRLWTKDANLSFELYHHEWSQYLKIKKAWISYDICMQYVWYMHTGVLCTCTVCRLQPSDAVVCGVPTPASRSCLGSQIITELIYNIWWGARPKTHLTQSCSPRILSSFWPRTSTNRGNTAIGDWFAVTVGKHSLRATKINRSMDCCRKYVWVMSIFPIVFTKQLEAQNVWCAR